MVCPNEGAERLLLFIRPWSSRPEDFRDLFSFLIIVSEVVGAISEGHVSCGVVCEAGACAASASRGV